MDIIGSAEIEEGVAVVGYALGLLIYSRGATRNREMDRKERCTQAISNV